MNELKRLKMNRFSRGSPFACQWNFLALFLQIFMILTSGIAAETHDEKRNCTYAVTIETSCIKGAETSNHVSLRFGDVKSNDVLVRQLNSKHVRWVDPLEPQVLDDVPRRPFQACMVDQFQVTGQCVESPICYLYLKLAGKDDWRPGFAQVHVLEDSHFSSVVFYFRRYLPRNAWYGSDACDTDVTPFGVKSRRKVFAKKSAQII